MTSIKRWIYTVLIAGVGAAYAARFTTQLPAHLAGSSTVRVTNLPHATLQHYEPAVHGRIAMVSEPGFMRLSPYLFVFTNDSPKGIAAITFKWQLIDEKGVHSSTVSWDAFFASSDLFPAYQQLVVFPQAVQGLKGSFITIRYDAQHTAQRIAPFERAKSVVLTVDLVMYEDGSIVGPDTTNTVATLRSRDAVITTILDQLDTTSLRDIELRTPSPDRQTIRVLNFLKTGPQMATFLAKRRRIPTLSKEN